LSQAWLAALICTKALMDNNRDYGKSNWKNKHLSKHFSATKPWKIIITSEKKIVLFYS
jgi:hypothetical protein